MIAAQMLVGFLILLFTILATVPVVGVAILIHGEYGRAGLVAAERLALAVDDHQAAKDGWGTAQVEFHRARPYTSNASYDRALKRYVAAQESVALTRSAYGEALAAFRAVLAGEGVADVPTR